MRDWLDEHWPGIVSLLFVGVFAPISFSEWRNGDVAVSLTAMGVIAAMVSTTWSIYYLRKSFELQFRPYLGITACQLVPTGNAAVILRLRLTNSGNVPGIAYPQESEWTHTGNTVALEEGETMRNVIYPGEEVWFGLGAPVVPPGQARIAFKYSDLAGTREYSFEIAYSVGQGSEPSIVRKTAT